MSYFPNYGSTGDPSTAPTKGGIFHLQKYADVDPIEVRTTGLQKDAMDHPVLVLHSSKLSKTAAILVITSLKDRSLVQAFPGKTKGARERRSHYLPILPAPKHPDSNVLLALKNPSLCRMKKDSNVRIDRAYLVPWNFITPFRVRGTHFKMDERSIDVIFEELRPEARKVVRLAQLAHDKMLAEATTSRPVTRTQPVRPPPTIRTPLFNDYSMPGGFPHVDVPPRRSVPSSPRHQCDEESQIYRPRGHGFFSSLYNGISSTFGFLYKHKTATLSVVYVAALFIMFQYGVFGAALRLIWTGMKSIGGGIVGLCKNGFINLGTGAFNLLKLCGEGVKNIAVAFWDFICSKTGIGSSAFL